MSEEYIFNVDAVKELTNNFLQTAEKLNIKNIEVIAAIKYLIRCLEESGYKMSDFKLEEMPTAEA